MNETFSLSLGRSPGLDSRISLSPVSGTVVIVDNDGQKQLSIITQKAAIALEPLTMRPDEWAEPSHK